jgi:hypothetical protein
MATSMHKERALELLGMGLIPSQVAAALGVEQSYMSQLLSDEHFASQVAEKRFESLSKHTERDGKYDKLEDELLEKMEDCIPFMSKPSDILRAIQVINSAKRRGASSPQAISQQNTVVKLSIPQILIDKFQMNINNQVITAGGQSLETIQSGALLKVAKAGEKNAIQSKDIADDL